MLPNKLYDQAGPFGCPQNLHDIQITPSSGEALAVGRMVLMNRSGADIDAGLFWRQPNAYWKAGIIDASDTPDYTDDTTNAQSTTANAFVNVFTTTNNDGFLVQSVQKFHAVSFVVDDAAGGSPVFAYSYYNGSAFATLTPVSSATFGSTGRRQALFFPPADWVVGTTVAVGSDSDKFAIQVVASTAPSDVCSISDVRVYSCLDFYPTLLDQNELINDFGGSEQRLPVGSSLAAYFGGTANVANSVILNYRAMSRQV